MEVYVWRMKRESVQDPLLEFNARFGLQLGIPVCGTIAPQPNKAAFQTPHKRGTTFTHGQDEAHAGLIPAKA